MPALAIIIVSWNTRELLDRCIRSVHASLAGSGIAYRVIVVDNASSDGTPAMLRERHPDVLLLEPGRNLGFAGGNNVALRAVLRSAREAQRSACATLERCTLNVELVLLLNPDAEVVGDAIPRLVRYLAAHPDVAVVGPRLRYPDGRPQPSRRRFPTPGVYFWESTPLEQCWPGNPWARRYRCADRPDDVEQEVDWLVGAALLVRRAAVERAGLLDEGFAMYSEELEWQRRIRGQGAGAPTPTPDPRPPTPEPYKIVFLPDAEIVHHEGKSSEQAPARRYITFQRSRLRDARMTYGPGFATLLWLFLLAAYAAELAVEAGKWLLGHRRPLRARRVVVYWQVLRGLW